MPATRPTTRRSDRRRIIRRSWAAWTEFHSRVTTLPEAERQIFELHYYLEIPQAEIARMTNLAPRQVSRLWVKAIEQLTQGFAEVEGIF